MKDFLLHEFLKTGPIGMLFLIIGAFFIGVFLVIIIRLNKSAIKYTYYDKKPNKMSLVIGHRGSTPIFDTVYSKEFVIWLWDRLKGCQAKIDAMNKIADDTGGK